MEWNVKTFQDVWVLMRPDDPAAVERGIGVLMVTDIVTKDDEERVLSNTSEFFPREDIEDWDSALSAAGERLRKHETTNGE